MTKLKLILFFAGLACISNNLFAQKDNDLVQFSGMVITADSLRALPLVSIRVKSTNKGTYSDAGGFFSFVARKGDTITFTSIGLKASEYVIPASLTSFRYSIIQPMAEDTFYLPETVIRPWPTPEEFNYYFVKARISDRELYQARSNTRSATLAEMAAGMSMDGNQQGKYYQQQQARQYYYSGQLPPQRLFDPFAWSEFYNSWKKGDYKKKD